MFKSKRIPASVISLTMALCAAGCGSSGRGNGNSTAEADNSAVSAKTEEESGKKISVVCTIFPEYDWVREIVGDNGNAELSYLLDNGVDLHSCSPYATEVFILADVTVQLVLHFRATYSKPSCRVLDRVPIAPQVQEKAQTRKSSCRQSAFQDQTRAPAPAPANCTIAVTVSRSKKGIAG